MTVSAFFDHDCAGFFISIFVLVHGVIGVHSVETVFLQVVGEEENESLVVNQLLESLEGELVEVVVDFHDLSNFLLVSFVDPHNFFRINQGAQIKYHLIFRNAHFLVALIDLSSHVGL